MVKRHWTNHTSFLYYYDANGNITRIFDGKKLTDYAYYTYDALNQLVREDNKAAGYTYVYTYSGGNITSKTTYAYTRSETLGTALKTETWTYGNANWPDLLTGYSDGTSTYTVSSDDLGNLTYIGSGSTNNTTHTWLGRLLESTTVTSGSTVTEIDYAYNGDGQRISKTVDGVTTQYYYNGDILAGMMIGSVPLVFMYDENGDYFGFTYSGNSYYYVKSLQGDVIGITDSTGTVIVQYGYDAWGNLNSISGSQYSTIGKLNPIRYRGYYYDTETGYYYLNSRYYSPDLCRFISADGYVSTGQGITDYNMFAYCGNNPVIYADSTGTARTHCVMMADGGGRDSLKEKTGTYTIGFTGSYAGGKGGSISLGITMDNQGNVGVLLSLEGDAATPNVSAGVFCTYTTAPNIYKQREEGAQIGGSVDVLSANIGYDFSMFKDPSTNEQYYGHTYSIGAGVPIIPFEIHGGISYTWVWGLDAVAFHNSLEMIFRLILTPR